MNNKFDELAKGLAQSATRRQALKRFGVGLAGREPPEDNQSKVKEHGLSFPIVLQKQWEVSRAYAFFATPVAYLIDESGMIAAEVAVGVDSLADLKARTERMFGRKTNAANTGLLKRVAGWPVRPLRRLFSPVQS